MLQEEDIKDIKFYITRVKWRSTLQSFCNNLWRL